MLSATPGGTAREPVRGADTPLPKPLGRLNAVQLEHGAWDASRRPSSTAEPAPALSTCSSAGPSALYEFCIVTHAPAKVAMSCPAGAVLGASSVVDSRIPKAATAALRPCSGQQRTLADTSYVRGKEVMNVMQSSRRTRTRATKGRAAASKPATESRVCQSAPTTPCAVSQR